MSGPTPTSVKPNDDEGEGTKLPFLPPTQTEVADGARHGQEFPKQDDLCEFARRNQDLTMASTAETSSASVQVKPEKINAKTSKAGQPSPTSVKDFLKASSSSIPDAVDLDSVCTLHPTPIGEGASPSQFQDGADLEGGNVERQTSSVVNVPLLNSDPLCEVRASVSLLNLTTSHPPQTEVLPSAIVVEEYRVVAGVDGNSVSTATTPFYKTKRFCCFAFLACIVLLAMVGSILGSILGSSLGSESSNAAATPSSTSYVPYYQLFADAVGNQLVFQDGTPHQLAAKWIIKTDPMHLSLQSDHIIQRYLLVLFYYQTTDNGNSSWRSCRPPTGDQDERCVFLNRVETPFVSENGTSSSNITFEHLAINRQTGLAYYRWLSGAHECLWAGILCDSNRLIRSMELFDQNLTGTLPTEIGAISFLQSFSVPFNLFHGTIPNSFAGLRHLVQLELQYNLLTGPLLDVWFQSTALLSLNIGGNMISGSITSKLELLSNLKGLFLFQNEFVGTIPTELGKISYLEFTRWHDNQFEGTIPTEIGFLYFLQEMFLHENFLNGTIPSEIGLLTKLTDLRTNKNKLSGIIPEEFYNLTKLSTYLDFSDLSLTGTLSTRIGNLTSLQAINLRQNDLTGTVPSELALLTNLQLLFLSHNQFVGSIPAHICRVELQLFEADCGSSGDGISCQCCTVCCDRTKGNKCTNQ